MAMDDAAMAVAFFASTASVAWSAAYAWGKWLARPRPPEPAPLPADAAHRLARLEHAVDAVAVEVERLGEAHRYTARLLDERLPAAPAGRPALPAGPAPRPVTPH